MLILRILITSDCVLRRVLQTSRGVVMAAAIPPARAPDIIWALGLYSLEINKAKIQTFIINCSCRQRGGSLRPAILKGLVKLHQKE